MISLALPSHGGRVEMELESHLDCQVPWKTFPLPLEACSIAAADLVQRALEPVLHCTRLTLQVEDRKGLWRLLARTVCLFIIYILCI